MALIEWVVRNRKRFDIRVLNVSCGGDYQASYLRDGLSQAAERATRAGILVCGAVSARARAVDQDVLPAVAVEVGHLDVGDRPADLERARGRGRGPLGGSEQG